MKWILSATLVASLSFVPAAPAQRASDQPAAADAQDTNISTYVEMLRSDVRANKTEVMGRMMGLNDTQAAKFWPIYREYDLKLEALNDKKVAGIMEYARTASTMTDAKAESLAKQAISVEAQRNDLKRIYFEKVNVALGGVLAARFLQVENQLLMLIDIQIASRLPIVGTKPDDN